VFDEPLSELLYLFLPAHVDSFEAEMALQFALAWPTVDWNYVLRLRWDGTRKCG